MPPTLMEKESSCPTKTGFPHIFGKLTGTGTNVFLVHFYIRWADQIFMCSENIFVYILYNKNKMNEQRALAHLQRAQTLLGYGLDSTMKSYRKIQTPKSSRYSEVQSLYEFGGQPIDRDDIKIEKQKVKLIKHGVTIMLKVNGDVLELLGFYNEGNIRGLARCALLAILERLIEEKMVKMETIISVSSPTPDTKIIQTYKNIGFEQKDARPGQPIVLEEQVCKVIETLQEWCKTNMQRDSLKNK